MTVAGAITAIQQTLWGIGNTVEALKESRRGNVWDAEVGRWVQYNLDDDIAQTYRQYETQQKQQRQTLSGKTSTTKVKESTYYDVSVGIAECFVYLHHEQPKNPLIHRDLKPANVLIDEHGHLRVVDMGMVATRSP